MTRIFWRMMGSLVWRSTPMRSTMTASRWVSVWPRSRGAKERPSMPGKGRGVGEVDDGGHKVEVGGGAVVEAVARDVGSGPEEGDADDGFVRHGGLSALAVVVDHFAVVGGEDDVGVVGEAVALKSLEDAADHVVDEGDHAVVEGADLALVVGILGSRGAAAVPGVFAVDGPAVVGWFEVEVVAGRDR